VLVAACGATSRTGSRGTTSDAPVPATCASDFKVGLRSMKDLDMKILLTCGDERLKHTRTCLDSHFRKRIACTQTDAEGYATVSLRDVRKNEVRNGKNALLVSIGDHRHSKAIFGIDESMNFQIAEALDDTTCETDSAPAAQLVRLDRLALTVSVGCAFPNMKACLQSSPRRDLACAMTNERGEATFDANVILDSEVSNLGVTVPGSTGWMFIRSLDSARLLAALQASPTSASRTAAIENKARVEQQNATRERVLAELGKNPQCKYMGFGMQCEARTKEECEQFNAKFAEARLSQSSCSGLPTTEWLAQRGAAWEKEACSDNNAEEQLRSEVGYGGRSPTADEITARVKKCVSDRAAQCQPMLDQGDVAGAGTCWRRWAWKRVGDALAPSLDPADVETCLSKANANVQAAASCVAMAEKSEQDILDKSTCLRTNKVPTTSTCGALDLATFYGSADRRLGLTTETTRVEAKAAPIRERHAVRSRVCTTYATEKFHKERLDRERRVGKIGGYVDTTVIRDASSGIETAQRWRAGTLPAFKKLWGRAFNRTVDCK
jgi:hypothetical protein